MTSNLKKVLATVAITLMVVTMLSVAAVNIFAGNLGCEDLSDCSGKASCGSSGTNDGCELTCSAGGSVSCDEVAGG